jgi:hypothetical protein
MKTIVSIIIGLMLIVATILFNNHATAMNESVISIMVGSTDITSHPQLDYFKVLPFIGFTRDPKLWNLVQSSKTLTINGIGYRYTSSGIITESEVEKLAATNSTNAYFYSRVYGSTVYSIRYYTSLPLPDYQYELFLPIITK